MYFEPCPLLACAIGIVGLSSAPHLSLSFITPFSRRRTIPATYLALITLFAWLASFVPVDFVEVLRFSWTFVSIVQKEEKKRFLCKNWTDPNRLHSL